MMNGPISIGYDPRTDSIVGCAWIGTALNQQPILATARLRPITETLVRAIVRAELKRAGLETDQVGFGFLKKLWKKAWNKAKTVAKAVGVAQVVGKIKKTAVKVLKTAKKIVQSPAFAAVVGIAAVAVPGAGPIIGASYMAVRAAMALADGVANKDPKALAAVGKYATSGEMGQKALALVQSVAPQAQEVIDNVNSNPWLQGLKPLLS